MGLFSRLRTPSHPIDAGLRARLYTLPEEVDDLRNQITRLKTEWQAEQLALSDLVGKMSAWVGRLAARERKKAAQQIERSDPDVAGPEENGSAAAPGDPRRYSKEQLRSYAATLRRNK